MSMVLKRINIFILKLIWNHNNNHDYYFMANKDIIYHKMKTYIKINHDKNKKNKEDL